MTAEVATGGAVRRAEAGGPGRRFGRSGEQQVEAAAGEEAWRGGLQWDQVGLRAQPEVGEAARKRWV